MCILFSIYEVPLFCSHTYRPSLQGIIPFTFTIPLLQSDPQPNLHYPPLLTSQRHQSLLMMTIHYLVWPQTQILGKMTTISTRTNQPRPYIDDQLAMPLTPHIRGLDLLIWSKYLPSLFYGVVHGVVGLLVLSFGASYLYSER